MEEMQKARYAEGAPSFHALSGHTSPNTSMCSPIQKVFETQHLEILWELHFEDMID